MSVSGVVKMDLSGELVGIIDDDGELMGCLKTLEMGVVRMFEMQGFYGVHWIGSSDYELYPLVIIYNSILSRRK